MRSHLKPHALTTIVVVVALLSSTGAFAQSDDIAGSARAQIAQLLLDKQMRTPAQQKIESQLLYAIRAQRGEALPVPGLRTGIQRESDGRVLADLTAQVTPALLERIEALGGTIVNSFERYDSIRALVPMLAVEAIAAETAVRNVRPADRFLRQGDFRGNSIITEGDEAHGADTARVNFGVDGTGVTACAMSDSVDFLATAISNGELPAGTTVLAGQSGNPGSSEGTALLEIIHDMAPGADLAFATGIGGLAQMAQNIEDLANVLGCDVIVDDILYFAEGVFQDDIIAQAVDTVVASGVIYFSSAGNSGNLNDNEAGVFEANFSGSPFTLPPPINLGVTAHDYGGSNHTNEVTEDPLNDAPFFTLQWSNPLNGSGDDYDLFLLDAAMANVLAASFSTQDGDDDPFESITSVGIDDTGNHLVVVKTSGADQHFHLNTHRGRLQMGTDGQIFGHPAAVGALAVAAVQVPPGGGLFQGTESVEPFSSDGPRRIFFDAGGTPVDTLEHGGSTLGIPTGIVRQKPDIAAADGVSTSTPGFMPFFGTSASAPHSAAIAALFAELFPSIPVQGMTDIFKSSALDIEDPGFDRDSGAGIIMTEDAMNVPIFVDGFESGDTSAWTK